MSEGKECYLLFFHPVVDRIYESTSRQHNDLQWKALINKNVRRVFEKTLPARCASRGVVHAWSRRAFKAPLSRSRGSGYQFICEPPPKEYNSGAPMTSCRKMRAPEICRGLTQLLGHCTRDQPRKLHCDFQQKTLSSTNQENCCSARPNKLYAKTFSAPAAV